MSTHVPWMHQRRRLIGAGAALLGGFRSTSHADAATPADAAADANEAAAGSGQGATSAWPNRSVRIVVPRAVAGTADLLARALAEHLGHAHGQRFLVDNQPEAAGANALRRVVAAPADGHTLLASDAAVTLAAPLLQPGLSTDTVANLAHVVLLADAPLVLLAHPQTDLLTLRALIDAGHQQRPDLMCAVAGVGSHGHLICEQLRVERVSGLSAVPYRGGAAATAAVLAREVPLAIAVLGSVGHLMAQGRLVGPAVSAPRRVDLAADVPTFVEFGLPQLVLSNWYGLSGPRGLAARVAGALRQGVQSWLRSDATRALFKARAYQAMSLSGDDFAAFIDAERRRWTPVLRALLQRTTG